MARSANARQQPREGLSEELKRRLREAGAKVTLVGPEAGKNYPSKRGRTRVELDDFRAFEEDKTLHGSLKGKVLMSIDQRGEWSGFFIDGEGRNWDFHCTRVQE